MSFQNEMVGWSSNSYGYNASDYASSDYRNYLNGETVKRSSIFNNGVGVQSGENINFLNRFKLTNYPLYTLIEARDLQSLYTSDDLAGTFPSKYSGMADKFWALSYKEYTGVLQNGQSSKGVAYMLGNVQTAVSWWLRTPSDSNLEAIATASGGIDGPDTCIDNNGVRPAFALAI